MTGLKRVGEVLLRILQVLLVIGILGLCWTVVAWSTRVLYRYWEPPFSAYVIDLLNVVFGAVFFGLLISLISFAFRHKQLLKLNLIIDAIRRISKGDFSVRIDGFERMREFETIVNSINEMAGALGQMETMRQDFISNVSHEIQSPLTSIRGFARALRRPDLSPEKRNHYLEIIESESRRLSQMSDNLLKLSSLEADRGSLQTNRFRLDRQLQNVVLACEPQWLAKNIQIQLDVSKLEVEGAEDLLSQVWMNLLHNGIKFTPEGGEIGVSLMTQEDKAVVTVTDNGIGISEPDLVHIFERFYKADKSRTRSSGGSGLGLSIVKKIVDIHEGEITVVSERGKGSSFRVAIPFRWKP
ncbi:Alkaline phosphatase synthesis sensor protein PhoR [compost metagenome]|uniref:sensor histidine kinase n=1 Tax=Paenibacillus sp. J53TS2 TaxID=2807197 RepID=UPI000FA15DD5|nr:HAMP domain-containing sensor histidine kinase [Paenibacillus sp. J53TS2]GIP46523.1 two-component sensor histidine kinase [Paenibacillus sp. J53TS2]